MPIFPNGISILTTEQNWGQWAPITEIRTELSRRGLSANGSRAELVERLEEHNKWILTPEGARERYQRKLDILTAKAMAAITPFDKFSGLPLEIRLMIWEYGLRSLVQTNFHSAEMMTIQIQECSPRAENLGL